jgi:hypothetical protein
MIGTPTPHLGIVKRHEATIVLHQDKRIEQTFTNADVASPHLADRPTLRPKLR